ncbi:MAG: PTS sugar transporter subunit IIC [Coprobacillaceae bacterium]
MKKVLDQSFEKLMPIFSKFSSQRHIGAIRDGFMTLMPLIIVSSIFILLNNVLFDSTNGFLKSFGNFDHLKEIGVLIYNASLGIMAILFAFALSYNLAKSYKEDGLMAGVLGVSLLVVMLPSVISVIPSGMDSAVEVGGVISQSHVSSTGLFIAIITGIIGTEAFIRLSRIEALRIKLPDTVPPMVAKSFNTLLPTIIVITVAAVFSFGMTSIFDVNIPDLVAEFIQAPLQGLVQSVPGLLLITFLSNLLWVFGIHGSSILSPLTAPILTAALQANMAANTNGTAVPNIITEPFINSFSLLGGGCCTIALLMAIFFVSKRQDHRAIAKISILPGLFNINEPVMFGLPVVLNPILMIPALLVPTINLIIAYFATSLGMIARTVVSAPWTTPPVLQAYLSTGGDIKAGILAALLLILDICIFIPFVLMSNKQYSKNIES